MAVGVEYIRDVLAASPTGPRTATSFLEGQTSATNIAANQLRQQQAEQAMRYAELEQPYVMANLERARQTGELGLRQAFEAEAARKKYIESLQSGGLNVGAVAPGAGALPTIRAPAGQPAGTAAGMTDSVFGPYKVVGTRPTASLIQNESGGNLGAVNQFGYAGALQIGAARLQDAINAGVVPPGTTPRDLATNIDLQQRTNAWHVSDINTTIAQRGLDRFIGTTINGVPVTPEGMIAVADLGGKAGLEKYLATGGQYNPSDANGTRLSDYMARHSGATGAASTGTPSWITENITRSGASGLGRDVYSFVINQVPSDIATRIRSGAYGTAAGGLISGLSSLGEYAFSPASQAQSAQARRASLAAAADWYESPQGQQAVLASRENLNQASSDPIGFYERNKSGAGAATTGGTMEQEIAATGVPQVAPGLLEPTPMGRMQPFSKEVGAALRAPAGAPTPMPNAKAYEKNPVMLDRDMQIIQFQDQQLVNLQKYLAASGNIAGAAEAGLKRASLMTQQKNLEGLQGIRMFDTGDYATASRVMSANFGRTVGFQPLDNGNFNLVVDGQTVQQNVSKAEIKDFLSYNLSDTYKQQTIKMQETRLALLDYQMREAIQSGNKIREETAKQEMIGLRDAVLQRLKNDAELGKFTVTKGEDGVMYYASQDGATMYVVTPDKTISINGQQLSGPVATRVTTGLSVPQQ